MGKKKGSKEWEYQKDWHQKQFRRWEDDRDWQAFKSARTGQAASHSTAEVWQSFADQHGVRASTYGGSSSSTAGAVRPAPRGSVGEQEASEKKTADVASMEESYLKFCNAVITKPVDSEPYQYTSIVAGRPAQVMFENFQY